MLHTGNNAVFSDRTWVILQVVNKWYHFELYRPLCIRSSSHKKHGKVGHRLFQGQGKKNEAVKFQSHYMGKTEGHCLNCSSSVWWPCLKIWLLWTSYCVLMFLRRVRKRNWMSRSIWATSSLTIKSQPNLVLAPCLSDTTKPASAPFCSVFHLTTP